MGMDPLDKLMKRQFEEAGPKRLDCPQEEIFARFMENHLSPDEHDALIDHVSSCGRCARLVAALKRLETERENIGIPVPNELERKTIDSLSKKAGSKGPGPSKYKNLWLLGFGIFMALSFIWSRYFLQMLVLAIFFGLKWLLDTRPHKVWVDITHKKEEGKDPGNRLTGTRDNPLNKKEI